MKKHISILLLMLLLAGPAGVRTAAADQAPAIISESAVLMDAKTGQVLFEKNMNEKLYPASITKILTILLGIEKGRLNDKITMSHQAVYTIPRGASHIALDEGEQITLEQALMAALLPSANDACNGIAEHISGSVSGFARLMNRRAREAGALNSSFVNPHGLPNSEQVTTAYDMAMITRAALQNDKFREIFSTVRYTIPPTNKQPEPRDLWSEHRMLTTNRFYYRGVIGGKTGYTRESQNTLVTAARRGDRELIAVVMKSEDFGVYKDTIALFDYGFNEFVEHSIPVPAAANVSRGQAEKTAIQNILSQNRDTGINRLLHKDISPQDVALDYNLVKNSKQKKEYLAISLHLKDAKNLMYPDLGTANLYGAAAASDKRDWTGILIMIVKIIIFVLLGLVALLFMLRWFFTWRRRKIRRKSPPRINNWPR